MNKCVERIYNGVIKENPTFVLMLGMCPTLATTTSAVNGLGMGVSTMAVLVFSNLIISLLRNIIPDRMRIPCYIVIVASLVTIVQLLMQAYVGTLYDALGIFIPLIVVNCIILGRAEAYASKNGPVESFFDGLGMGLGFTIALTILGCCRELLSAGSVFGVEIIPDAFHIAIFGLAPGAFFVLAVVTALQNYFKAPSATNVDNGSTLACGGNCMTCTGSACMANHEALETRRLKIEEENAARKKAAAEAKQKEAAAKAGSANVTQDKPE